jgi:hypothetical protein
MVYAFSTHESSDGLLSAKLRVISGNATKRMVVSRKVASVASDAMVRVRREWFYTMGSVLRREAGVK